MPLVTIDSDANALLDEYVGNEKKKAADAKKPVKDINKARIISDLVKKKLAKPQKAEASAAH